MRSRRRRRLVAMGVVAAVVVSACGGDDDGDATSTTGGVTGPDFHSLVADPNQPGTLYVGGHTAGSMSTDSGKTWERLDSLDDADLMGWAFTGDHVYVSGHPGIRVGDDVASDRFRTHNDGLPDTDVHALGTDGDVLYGASPAVGVFASRDGATRWQVLTEEAGHGFFGRILVDANDTQRLVAADARAGVVESRDGGRSWTQLGGTPPMVWVSWRPGSPDHIVASSPDLTLETRDGGATWEEANRPEGASLVELDPHDEQRRYAGVHEDDAVTIHVSLDDGASWQRS